MPIRLPETIERLRPYVPGRPIEEVRREYGLTEIVKLASNENPLGPPPLAMSAIVDYARFAGMYPDAGCVELKEAIAEARGVPVTSLCIGNGSDEMIHFLSALLLQPGDNVVMADPGFSRYESEATAAGAETRKVRVDATAKHDLQAMAGQIDERTKIIWIANPNNPTGTIVRRDDLEIFLTNVPENVAVVLDEAYYEFATVEDYASSTDFVRPEGNVIGLRTFSKTYGLAGLRIGYAIGPDNVIDGLERIREPFNVNAFAQKAAIAALNDKEHLARTISVNKTGVQRLTTFLNSLGFSVSESFANFVWCDYGSPSGWISDALLQRGVIIRPGSVFGCPNHLRISVGTEEELDRFESALSAVMQETALA